MNVDEKKLIKDQLQHMAARILIEGEKIQDESLIVGYDNGGGQSGVRENPFYPAYEKLVNTYIKTLAAAKDICGEDTEVSSLDSLRARFKVVS